MRRMRRKSYALRRRRCKRTSRLDDTALAALVSEKLLLFWSPEQIAGRLAREQGRHVVSFVTIYRAIHRGTLSGISWACLRRRGRKYSPSEGETRGRLHGYRTIRERPLSAELCSCYGHWEGDTVAARSTRAAWLPLLSANRVSSQPDSCRIARRLP